MQQKYLLCKGVCNTIQRVPTSKRSGRRPGEKTKAEAKGQGLGHRAQRHRVRRADRGPQARRGRQSRQRRAAAGAGDRCCHDSAAGRDQSLPVHGSACSLLLAARDINGRFLHEYTTMSQLSVLSLPESYSTVSADSAVSGQVHTCNRLTSI